MSKPIDLDEEIKVAQVELNALINQAEITQDYLSKLLEMKSEIMEAVNENTVTS